VAETIETIERLEELAAWNRMRAAHAGSDWVWEMRIRTAEDIEQRVAHLRAQQRRDSAKPKSQAAGGPVTAGEPSASLEAATHRWPR